MIRVPRLRNALNLLRELHKLALRVLLRVHSDDRCARSRTAKQPATGSAPAKRATSENAPTTAEQTATRPLLLRLCAEERALLLLLLLLRLAERC